MFGTLIESRPIRQRRRGSAALSAVVHLTLITGAVAATIPAGVKIEPPRVRPDSIIWIAPGRTAAPVIQQRPVARCDFCIPTPRLPRFPTHPLPIGTIPDPHFNVDSMVVVSGTGLGNPRGSLVDNPYARGAGVGSGADVFKPDQVERTVAILTTVRPTYPDLLRTAGIEGRVVVRFVVDTAGRVEPGSITTIESTHALFDRAVRDILPRLRFAPAEADGRRVRQLVEMSFQFSLSNR